MISRQFNTIFVHVPKTAGQSIEHIFLRNHGLTWDTRAELLLRYNGNPLRGPERLAHLFAREYVEHGYVTPQEFASFHKFAVVRNPYDRIISEYRYRDQHQSISIEQFLSRRSGDPYSDTVRHREPQLHYVTDHTGKTIVDQVLRFENLDQELPLTLMKIFGRTEGLHRHNESGGAKLRREDLPDSMRTLIFKTYECDFDAFGYSKHL